MAGSKIGILYLATPHFCHQILAKINADLAVFNVPSPALECRKGDKALQVFPSIPKNSFPLVKIITSVLLAV